MEHKITGFDNYLFKLGRHYEIYEKLGAHLVSEAGENGTYFSCMGAKCGIGFRCR